MTEFWRVVTRPVNANGYNLSPQDAEKHLQALEARFSVLPDTDAIFGLWRQIALSHGISGVQVHDARLVAVMQAHHVGHLLIFNTRDFARYVPQTGITLLDPATV